MHLHLFWTLFEQMQNVFQCSAKRKISNFEFTYALGK